MIKHGHAKRGQPTAEYNCYMNMNGRCHDPEHPQYKDYGGRGITVCPRWRFGENERSGFQCFLEDMGDRPTKQHSIHRIENDYIYCKDNCEWATQKTQQRAKRSNIYVIYNNQQMVFTDALIVANIKTHNAYHWLRKGLTHQEIIDKYAGGKLRRNIPLYSYGGKTMSINDWAKEKNTDASMLLYRLKKLNWSFEKTITTPPYGDYKRFSKLDPEERSRIAREAANKRWHKPTNGLF